MMPEMSFPSQFKKDMSKLQQVYIDRLKHSLAEMGRLKDALAQTPPPRKETQQLYNIAHKVAESGLPFGFAEVSRTARELYLSLAQLLEPSSGPQATAFHADAISKLYSCERACQEASSRQPQESAERMTVPEAPPLRIAEGENDVYVVAGQQDRSAGEALASGIAQFGYDAYVVTDAEAFRDVFKKGHMKAAIVFSELTERDIPYIQGLRQANAFVPMVIVSPYDDFEARLKAARAGAQGYFSGKGDVLRIIDKIERLSEQCAPAPDYHVLVIDDDEMLTEFYRVALQRTGLKVSVLNDPRQVPNFLKGNDVDLLLIDNAMPGCPGRDLAAVIRQHDEHVGVPIVFLSPQEEIDAMLGGNGPGIDDFIAKPFVAEDLLAVVKSRTRRAAELKSLLVHDSFTGLYNHEHFTAMLSQEIMRTKRTGALAVYAIIDIDHIKQINSTNGHHAGDQIIKMVSHMLRHHLRRTDIVGRIGGEAFGVVLPGCELKNAQESLEKFRQKATASFFSVGTQKIRVTLSGGLTIIDGKVGADEVIRRADKALHGAKAQGRNQILTE